MGVIHLAAEVGGIEANRRSPARISGMPTGYGYRILEASRMFGVRKLLTVGTVCSYPKHGTLPLVEDELWSGYPEETNAPYGIAKKTL